MTFAATRLMAVALLCCVPSLAMAQVKKKVIPADPFSTKAEQQKKIRDFLSLDQRDVPVFDSGLSQAVRVAVKEDPKMDIQRAVAAQQKASIGIAGSARLPQLDLYLSTGREYGKLGGVDIDGDLQSSNISLQASQLLFDFGATGGAVKQARRSLLAAEYEILRVRDEISAEVTRAYVDVAEARDLLFAAEQNIAEHKSVLRMVEASQEKGNATQADVSRARTRLNFAQTVQKDIIARLYSANDEFFRLMGAMPGYLRAVTDLSDMLNRSLDANLDFMEAMNPRLGAATYRIKAAEAALASKKAGFFPTLSLNGTAQRRENENGFEGEREQLNVSLSLRYKIYAGGRKFAEVRRSRAALDEEKARFADILSRVSYELRSNWRAYQKSEGLQDLNRRRLAESSEVARLYQSQFRAGKRTLFELTDSQDDLYNARSEEIINRYTRLRAMYSILQLQGRLFETLAGSSKTASNGSAGANATKRVASLAKEQGITLSGEPSLLASVEKKKAGELSASSAYRSANVAKARAVGRISSQSGSTATRPHARIAWIRADFMAMPVQVFSAADWKQGVYEESVQRSVLRGMAVQGQQMLE